MRKLFIISCTPILFFLASCESKKNNRTLYFDSLINDQVTDLAARKSLLTKIAAINGKEDKNTFTPDAKTWRDELDVFRQLGVFEKPSYRAVYEITDQQQDAKSNLLVRSYHAKSKIPVMELRFYYRDKFENLKIIEAVYVDENSLFTGKRFLKLEFDDAHGRPELIHYAINGFQKMILTDTVHFSISSAIHH